MPSVSPFNCTRGRWCPGCCFEPPERLQPVIDQQKWGPEIRFGVLGMLQQGVLGLLQRPGLDMPGDCRAR